MWKVQAIFIVQWSLAIDQVWVRRLYQPLCHYFFCLLWTCLCVRNCFLLPKDFPQSSHLCTSCIFMCLFRSFFALNFLLKMGWMVHVFHVSPHWARSKFFAANFTLALFITLLCCSPSEPETLCSSELGFCCCSLVPETLFSSEEGGKVSLIGEVFFFSFYDVLYVLWLL